MAFCPVRVPSGTVMILEKLGKFKDVLPPGCHCVESCTSELRSVSLRLQRLTTNLDCPSKDSTMVRAHVVVMHQVIPSEVHIAFYSLQNSGMALIQYVQAACRAHIAEHTLEELFVSKEEVARKVLVDLGPQLRQFGLAVIDVLFVDLSPNNEVRRTMNQQLMQRCERQAAMSKGEIDMIALVKAAEAEAEVARLSGVGLAAQRKGVTGGFRQALELWKQSAAENGSERPNEAEVMAQLLMTQYFDMLHDAAKDFDVKPMVCYMPIRRRDEDVAPPARSFMGDGDDESLGDTQDGDNDADSDAGADGRPKTD